MGERSLLMVSVEFFCVWELTLHKNKYIIILFIIECAPYKLYAKNIRNYVEEI